MRPHNEAAEHLATVMRLRAEYEAAEAPVPRVLMINKDGSGQVVETREDCVSSMEMLAYQRLEDPPKRHKEDFDHGPLYAAVEFLLGQIRQETGEVVDFMSGQPR